MFVFCVCVAATLLRKNPDVFVFGQTICMFPLFTGTLQGLSSCAALGSLRSDSDRAARLPLTRVTSCADSETDDRTDWFAQGCRGAPGIRADTPWPRLGGSQTASDATWRLKPNSVRSE